MIIDNSQLSCFINCPRRYRNTYLLNLHKLVEDEREVHKNWGSAHHKALEAYYKGKSKEEACLVFTKEFPHLEGDKVRTHQHGLQLLNAYFNYYEGNTNELGDKHLTTLEVEIKDSFKIANDIEWLVKIDRIVKNNAGIWIMDNKVTTKSLYTFSNTFTPNMQVSGYVDYAIRKYGQCSGFIPNVLWYGHRERAYRGEPAGFHCQFQRDIINRTQEQIKDFEDNVIGWVKRLRQAQEDNLWTKNEQQCVWCGFKELCTSVDDENVLETIYEKFNPLEYLEV